MSENISKKIVAIGGGENGRLKSDGTRLPYELEKQDREIIRLTGKENPNFFVYRTFTIIGKSRRLFSSNESCL